jgi:ADP-heptose:LPS heptosyltransferase
MIGDVLVSSLLCENLKKAYPLSQIDYMVYESTIGVLQGNPFIDNLVLFKEEHRKSKLSFYKFIKGISDTNYDVVIDSYSKLESWITMLFLKSTIRISYKKPGRNFLYDYSIKMLDKPTSNIGLIIERRLSLLSPLKLRIPLVSNPKLYISKEELSFANAKFDEFGIDKRNKIVMVSIIGSSKLKTYPLEKMAEVIEAIVEKSNAHILFNYIPNQIEDAKIVFNACNKVTQNRIYFDLLGKNLREFIAIMNNCDLIIGNDGGAINMAKALNKPSFIIFSPWIEKMMWATFDDGVFHKSVHLNDYKQHLFIDKTQKELKSLSLKYYDEFKFKYFKKELLAFLSHHQIRQSAPLNFEKIYENHQKLSAVVITYNELDNLEALMASISFANEILVVDSYSTDGTFEVLQKYNNVKVMQREFVNFSDQRNFAASQASNDWILFVDADERISAKLQIEILDKINESGKIKVFGMKRKFYFSGTLLRYGGFQSEKVYRLYHKEFAKYNPSKFVHEVLEIKGKTKLLKNRILHYSYVNNNDYKQKLTKYAVLRAQELKNKGVNPVWYMFFLKPAYRFFNMFIMRFGMLDGKEGFQMAKLGAFGVFQRYVELRKINKN